MKSKVLLSTLIISLVSFVAKAQIGKGSVWLGGGVGFGNYKDENLTGNGQKIRSFNFNPGIGKAIKENTIAGADLMYSTQKNDNGNLNPLQKSISYGAGVFMRRYVPIVDRFYIFGQGRIGYGWSKQTTVYGINEEITRSWSTGLSFYPGISFSVNKKLHLESGFNNLFSVEYARSKKTSNATGSSETIFKSDSFSAGASLNNSNSNFYIGFRLLINNKG